MLTAPAQGERAVSANGQELALEKPFAGVSFYSCALLLQTADAREHRQCSPTLWCFKSIVYL